MGEACQHHLGVDIFKHGRGVMSTILGVALRQDQHAELPEMEAALPGSGWFLPRVVGFDVVHPINLPLGDNFYHPCMVIVLGKFTVGFTTLFLFSHAGFGICSLTISEKDLDLNSCRLSKTASKDCAMHLQVLNVASQII